MPTRYANTSLAHVMNRYIRNTSGRHSPPPSISGMKSRNDTGYATYSTPVSVAAMLPSGLSLRENSSPMNISGTRIIR